MSIFKCMLRISRPYVRHPMGLYYIRHVRHCLHLFTMAKRSIAMRGKFDVKTVLEKLFEDAENLNERYIL